MIAGRFPPGGGDGDNRDVHLQTPEYGCAVHCNETNYRPVSVGVVESRLMGTHVVVVIDRGGLHRPE